MNTRKSLHLYWVQDINNNWVPLYSVDLNDPYFDCRYGVYIIWYFDDNNYPHIVRVGQGEIKERLRDHRTTLLDYLIKERKILYVTWAHVWMSDRDGVEAYLGNELYTEIGTRYPNAEPIEVNLPPLNLTWNYAHNLRRSYRSQANPFSQFQTNLYKTNPFLQ